MVENKVGDGDNEGEIEKAAFVMEAVVRAHLPSAIFKYCLLFLYSLTQFLANSESFDIQLIKGSLLWDILEWLLKRQPNILRRFACVRTGQGDENTRWPQAGRQPIEVAG